MILTLKDISIQLKMIRHILILGKYFGPISIFRTKLYLFRNIRIIFLVLHLKRLKMLRVFIGLTILTLVVLFILSIKYLFKIAILINMIVFIFIYFMIPGWPSMVWVGRGGLGGSGMC